MSDGHNHDPAFPSEPRTNPNEFDPGMTLTEYYVGQALRGVAVKHDGNGDMSFLGMREIDIVAKNALAMAQAAVKLVRP